MRDLQLLDLQDTLRRRLAELWKVVDNNEAGGLFCRWAPRHFCLKNGNTGPTRT